MNLYILELTNEKINAMNIITLKDVTFAVVKRKLEKIKKNTHLHLSRVYPITNQLNDQLQVG